MGVYRTLLASNCTPDEVLIAAMINAGRNCGQPGWGLVHGLNDIDRLNISLKDDHLCHILVAACGESGDADSARRMLTKLKELKRGPGSGVGHIDAVDCGQLCKALVSGGDVVGAFEVLDLMTSPSDWNIVPSAVLFKGLLPACRDLSRGRRLHALITEGMIPLDDSLGAALVSMYARCGTLSQAMEAFHLIPHPELISWTAIIGGHARRQEGGKRALELLDEMLVRGVRPNAVTFVAAVLACKSLGDLNGARQLHSLINASRIPLEDDVLGTALITMYGTCGDLGEALAAFDSIPPALRRVGSWTAIIAACVKLQESSKALTLFDDMIAEGKVIPDAMLLVSVLPACGDIAAITRGRLIFSLINKHGIIIDDFLDPH